MVFENGNSTCKPKIVSSLLRESGKGKLDFSHPFQRKEWTMDQIYGIIGSGFSAKRIFY